MDDGARLDIAVVAPDVAFHDGQGRAALELVTSLRRRGHHVTVYSYRLDRDGVPSVGPEVRHRRLLRLPGPELPRTVVSAVLVSLALRRADHDVVHVLGAFALPPGQFAMGADFSYRGWRRSWRPGSTPRLYHRAYARLGEAMERVVSARAAVVVAVAAPVAADLGVEPARFVVSPNGVAATEFPLVGAEERVAARLRFGVDGRFVVGCIGENRTGRKGLDALLRAVAAGPGDETVLAAGAGTDVAGRRPVVVGVGKVPCREVLAACDAVAVPSRYEPFSLVAIEAACAGVPLVLSAAVGAVPLLDGAVVVVDDPDDVGALRAALDRIRDPAVAPGLAAEARRRAAAMEWEDQLVPAVDALERIARRPNGRAPGALR